MCKTTSVLVAGLLSSFLASPALADHARDVSSAQVVVVSGSADHMEQVLRRAKVNFALVSPEELPSLPLNGHQVLMVNCTGEMSKQAKERVRRFVRAGGFLYTTDHAVANLIEPTFPGYIRWNRKTTNEAIFPMEIPSDADRGLLEKIGTSGHPRWQLAGGGYLFDIVDAHKVDVLMTSSAVGKLYGTAALGVRFRVDDGQVIHVTGHFFTQPGQQPEVASAARAFEQLSENVANAKAADKVRIDNMYDDDVVRSAQIRSAPSAGAPAAQDAAGRAVVAPSASKVKVLEKNGEYTRVRTAQGDEGWVQSSQLAK